MTASIWWQHKVFHPIFRCIRQERISIRKTVHPSVSRLVSWLVSPPVHYAKTTFLGCFWPWWDPLLNLMINQHVLEPPLLLSHFTRLFVHRFLHICHMINTRKDTVRTHIRPSGLVYENATFWGSLSNGINITGLRRKRSLYCDWIPILYSRQKYRLGTTG